jgi:hypothetical protein
VKGSPSMFFSKVLKNFRRVFSPFFNCTICCMLLLLSSCTLLTHSPYLVQRTAIPVLQGNHKLITNRAGELPYQRWRVAPWDDQMRYVWLVGNYNFDRVDSAELILYFHGMHAKDYYPDFKRELEALVEKRPNKPFIFIGYVDCPHIITEERNKERWNSLLPSAGEKPEKLIQTINTLYKALKLRFPNIKKEKTQIVLAGFSGGGKVLDGVGNWLAKAEPTDPWANVLRSRIHKIVYFDCWFDKQVVSTVPILLETNPKMQIVGTVHMKKPSEHAAMLADKYKMKKDHSSIFSGLEGRIKIFHGSSHWNAMIARLKEAL